MALRRRITRNHRASHTAALLHVHAIAKACQPGTDPLSDPARRDALRKTLSLASPFHYAKPMTTSPRQR